MLLAEELALVAINPETGRHGVGARSHLNACLAGLLVAELVLEGAAAVGEGKGRVDLTSRRLSASDTASPVLGAAADVVAEKAPKLKAVLQHMSRGIESRLGVGTWDAVVSGLVADGLLAPTEGTVRSRNDVADVRARDGVIARLRSAADSDHPMGSRTALLFNMTGPASLLELVAPERRTRRHARCRIDHGLDGTELEVFGKTVRKVIADAAAAAASGYGAGGAVAATSG